MSTTEINETNEIDLHIAEARKEALQEIEKDTEQMVEIMDSLSEQIHDQDEIVEWIAAKTDNAKDNIIIGNNELEEADESKSRWRNFIWKTVAGTGALVTIGVVSLAVLIRK